MNTPAIAGLTETRKDLRAASQLLSRDEIRYLVKSYYQVQEFRKSSGNMARAMSRDEKPCQLVSWLADSQRRIEDDIKISLDVYAMNDPTGAWALSQHGIGPVIAAGLLAHIDITRAPTVGHIWSFGGWNPDQKWLKGQKRPFNAALKQVFYKIGDSFVKTSNSAKSVYGPIYRQRKELETQRNENGEFAAQAARTLKEKRITEPATRKCYEAGRLPPGAIDMRSRRIAVKLFLSHFHDVLTWNELGHRAPQPYAFAHLGHAHILEPTNPPWPDSEARCYDRPPIQTHKRSLFTSQGGICPGCREAYDYGEMTVAYLIPPDHGGKDLLGNLQVLCRSCHREPTQTLDNRVIHE